MSDDRSGQTAPDRRGQAAVELIATVLAASGGAATTLALGPMAGAAAAAVPRALEGIIRWRLSYAAEAAERALNEVGSYEEFVDALQRSEQVRLALMDALDAAARTSMAAKRQLLGLAIAQAAVDKAKIDTAQLRIAALEDLDVPHLRGLERLRLVLDSPEARQAANDAATNARHEDDDAAAAAQSGVLQHWGRDALAAEPSAVRQALLRHGLVDVGETWGTLGQPARLTQEGRALLDDLRAEGAEEIHNVN